MPEPFEKTPKNWRWNHKDFKDVYETTYVKGTITELKRKKDVPKELVIFESMAKVDCEGAEADDYIPIFYKPKAGYWDSDAYEAEQVQAQDYDEDQECYKRAWMSFRPGDEVLVLCIEGKAKAILGFYDGCPRIGEAVMDITFGSAKFKCKIVADTEDPYVKWYREEKGPDGKDLGLKLDSRQLYSGSLTHDQNPKKPIVIFGDGVECAILHPDTGAPPDLIWAENRQIIINYHPITIYNIDFVVPVGPYLVVVCMNFYEGGGYNFLLQQWSLGEPYPPAYSGSEVSGVYSWSRPYKFDMACVPTDWIPITWDIKRYYGDPKEPAPLQPSWINFFVAPYSKELANSVAPSKIHPGQMNEYPEEFVRLYIDPEAWDGARGMDAKVMAHPHTKAELQAAGQWPDLGS